MATHGRSRILRFSVFEVDLEAGELRKSGLRQKLTGQPFEVLRVLLEHPREIVTHEKLRQSIWPKDTIVDYDLALRKAITRLREVLIDSAESPRFIETVPRRGYRFIAPLIENRDDGAAAELPLPKRRWSRRSTQAGIVVGLGAALLLALWGVLPGKFFGRQFATKAAPEIRSLAVLPLQNLSTEPAQEYFSDGITDALITDLAQIGSLKVISRTSSMQYKQTKKSLPEIARELNVDGIVEGTVQRSGDRVRITAHLIHGPSDKQLWATTYERDMRDVFALERDVTEDIAHRVQAQLRTENQSPAAHQRPINLTALEAYLQGNFHLAKSDKGNRDEELRKARECFQHAVDADPNFAPAYIGLSRTYHDLWWPSAEDSTRMRRAAEKAVELDSTSSDAREALGLAKQEGDWDWPGAEEEYRRAIALNPNSVSAHSLLGWSLDNRGEMDAGWNEAEIAQQLDPSQDHLSDGLYIRGQYDRAIELLSRTAEANPDYAMTHWSLSQVYMQKGMYAESVQELGKMMTLFGLPEVATRVQRAFASSGWRGAQFQWAKELEQAKAAKQAYMPGILAQAYAQAGEKDRAFYWLEHGRTHRHLATSDPVLEHVKVDPSFTPLRSDPRFNAFLRRAGLKP